MIALRNLQRREVCIGFEQGDDALQQTQARLTQLGIFGITNTLSKESVDGGDQTAQLAQSLIEAVPAR